MQVEGLPGSSNHKRPSAVESIQTHTSAARSPHHQPLEPRRLLTNQGIAAILLAVVLLVFLITTTTAWSMYLAPDHWVLASVANIIGIVFTLFARGHFRTRMTTDLLSELPIIAVAASVGFATGLVILSFQPDHRPDPSHLVVLLGMLFTATGLGHFTGQLILRSLWKRGLLRSAAVVYGAGDLARELAIELSICSEQGVDIVGFVGEVPNTDDGIEVCLYNPDVDLATVFNDLNADRLIIVDNSDPTDHDTLRAARWATANGVPAYVLPGLRELGLGLNSMGSDRIRGYTLVRVQRSPHPRLGLATKRLIDITVSLAVLTISAPLIILAALAVRFTSPGPVLFGQQRVGRDGETIQIYKLRSMATNDVSDVEWVSGSRVTTVGRWLRRTNIDELPQLWSVLRGDMSLVGPRPERPAFVDRFSAEIPHYSDRHRMPVGVTGLAQIVGLRGDTSIAERVKYDNLYIDQWSLTSDLLILIKTLKAVVMQERYEARVRQIQDALKVDETSTSASKYG